MEMSHIEAFVTIAQVKNFSRAAMTLHLSQPAISRRIRLLEQELNVSLFERVHKGALLTEAGCRFLPYARRILAAARDGIDAIRAMEQHEIGTVKLALVGSLASTNLTQTLLNFRKAYPKVKLLPRTALSSEVSALVQGGEVHLGLRYFPDSHPDLVSYTVEKESLAVVCSIHHKFRGSVPELPEELKEIPWVSYPIGSGSSGEPFARMLKQKLIVNGLSDAQVIEIDSLTAQKRMIEADFGIGLLPVSSIREELKLGTLRVLDIPKMKTKVPVNVLYRRHGYLSHAAKRLLEELSGSPQIMTATSGD